MPPHVRVLFVRFHHVTCDVSMRILHTLHMLFTCCFLYCGWLALYVLFMVFATVMLLCCVHGAAMCCVFVCLPACLFARPFVRLVVNSFRSALLFYVPVYVLVSCTVLYAHNLQSSPLPCHLLAAVLESKGRCNSNGISGSNEGRPYTLWPNLQTHISRTVNAAHDRRAPWV